ncbi:phage integrase N-terminal SAM-like domain-containing protein [uncultured Desulfosarcina sp.]|uniref:phage integrase N-terminal SAM-like domain-containing protein n=1 Tax=uncultured Desulfosarcina sp. TaxID=218289 RepID=UPI003749BED6
MPRSAIEIIRSRSVTGKTAALADRRFLQGLKHQSLVNYTGYMNRAVAAWGDRNIKTISEGDIEDFLFDDHLNKDGESIASKTRHELKSVLSQFFKWVCRRERLRMPELPELSFESELRSA